MRMERGKSALPKGPGAQIPDRQGRRVGLGQVLRHIAVAQASWQGGYTAYTLRGQWEYESRGADIGQAQKGQ